MVPTYLLLVYVLTSQTSGIFSCGPVDSCETTGKVDETCPSDCSQNYRRAPSDDADFFFNCSIGGINSINKFRESHPMYFGPTADKIFDAPKLLDISFYRKTYADTNIQPNPALRINFLLPKGVNPSGVNPLLPKAVLLKFESIEDPIVQDTFYYKCPRERIFQFHNYKLSSTYYELYNPRNLTFDCLVGLDQCSQVRVYKIMLQTVQGRSAVYTVTVNVFTADLTDKKTSQVVIATQVNEEQMSIYAVVQKVPGAQGYMFQLVKAGNPEPVREIPLPPKNNTFLFDKVEPGTYVVKIMVRSKICEEFPFCMNTTSYNILVPGYKDSVHYADPRENGLKLVAMVMGCAVGAIIGLLVVWAILRSRREKGTVYGWMLHPYKPDTGEYEAVDRLVEYLEETGNCRLEKCYSDDWDETIPESKLKDRCDAMLGKNAKLAVIVTAKDTFKPDTTCSYENFYSYCVAKVMDKKKVHNSLRVFPVDFPFSKHQLAPIFNDSRCFHMMQDISELTKEIESLNDLPSPSLPVPLADTSKKYAALSRAISNLDPNYSSVPKRDNVQALSRDMEDPVPKWEVKITEKSEKKQKNWKTMLAEINTSNEDLDNIDYVKATDPLLSKSTSPQVTKENQHRDVSSRSPHDTIKTSSQTIRKTPHGNTSHFPGNNGYVSTTSPLVTGETQHRNNSHFIDNSDYVSETSSLVTGKTQHRNASQVPDNNGYVLQTSPLVTGETQHRNASQVPDNNGYVPQASPLVTGETQHRNASQVPDNNGYVLQTSPLVTGETQHRNASQVPDNNGYVPQASPLVTGEIQHRNASQVPDNNGYVLQTSTLVTGEIPHNVSYAPDNRGYVSTTSALGTSAPHRNASNVPDNKGYVSHTSPLVTGETQHRKSSHKPDNNGYVPQSSSLVTGEAQHRNASHKPDNIGYVPQTSPLVTGEAQHKIASEVLNNSGYVSQLPSGMTVKDVPAYTAQSQDSRYAMNLDVKPETSKASSMLTGMPGSFTSDNIVRPKNKTPNHAQNTAEYTDHDFTERCRPHISRQPKTPGHQAAQIKEEYMMPTIHEHSHPGIHPMSWNQGHPHTDGGGLGRNMVDSQNGGYVMHEDLIPGHHDDHLHENNHARYDRDRMNFNSSYPSHILHDGPECVRNHGQKHVKNHGQEHVKNHGHEYVKNHGQEYVQNHGPEYVSHVDDMPNVGHVLMGQDVHPSWQGHADFEQGHGHHKRFHNDHVPYQSYNKHKRYDADHIEMGEHLRYVPHSSNALHATPHSPPVTGHQPYVSCHDFDWSPDQGHTGHIRGYERRPVEIQDLPQYADYNGNRDIPVATCFTAHRKDTGCVSQHINSRLNPPMLERQISNRSDSILSPDSSLEYETSFDSGQNNSAGYNQMMMGDSARNQSGYVAHNFERHAPIGASDNSVAAAGISFGPVDPICLEKSLSGCKVSDGGSDKPRRSQTPPISGFLNALNLEGTLREEYNVFDPIPPEDDESVNGSGSITGVMDDLEKITTSNYVHMVDSP